MADDRYTEILQWRQEAAHKRLLQGLENQRQANLADYQQAIAEGDTNNAAFAESEYLRHTRELNELTGGQAAQQQQQQAPQQAQPQSQFTAMEQELLRDYPQIAADPRKWAVALAASRNLQLTGHDRNSVEYAQALLHACDITDATGAESLEVNSPDTALAACQSKYGPVTVEEYNQGVQRLIQEKRTGKYPMGQT
jgi:hypothetical protein